MEKFIDVLDKVTNQLVRGLAACTAAKQLHKAKHTSARYFFTTAYLSCLETSVMTLARMALSHDDSISIDYLLNFARGNVRNFPHADDVGFFSFSHGSSIGAIALVNASKNCFS